MMPTIVPISVSPREKPEKFNGLNFKKWQHKMLFYLTTLNLARFLTKDAPKLKDDSTISKSSMMWMLGNILTFNAETMS